MRLFDVSDRTDVDSKKHSENTFTFLNRSGKPEFERVRSFLETCFEHYPDEEKPELKSRFASSTEYDSAQFELLLHELLLKLGYKIEIHPEIAGTNKRPDFLVERGELKFYLEAVLATDVSDEERANLIIRDKIYDAIDKAESSNFWLNLQSFRLVQGRQPVARHIKSFLNRELSQLDPDKLSVELEDKGGFSALPLLCFEDENITIVFQPIPKSPAKRGDKTVRNIGFFPMEGGISSTKDAIRRSVLAKATRYGNLDLPFVVAVNSTSYWGTDIEDAQEALLGSEGVQVLSPYETRRVRQPDGAFCGPGGPQNTRVSAVLVGYMSTSTLASSHLELHHHPWAALQLPAEALPLSQYALRLDKEGQEEIQKVDGQSVGEVFGVSAPWPRE